MEQAHILNEASNLCGIVSEAERDRQTSTNQPAILMINAGFLHHVGPYRLYVDLSRRLTKAGFDCLRFDLDNVGDSEGSSTTLDYQQQTPTDIRQAMDFMQDRYRSSSFIVMGLCSGADDSFEIASLDDRVSAAIMIDGHGFRTPRFYVRHFVLHFGRRVLSLRKWAKIGAKLKRMYNNEEDEEQLHSGELDDNIRIPLSRAVVSEKIDALTSRGCPLHFIYTGGVSDYYNYHGQFEDFFPQARDNPLLSATYYPDSDHLFMLQAHRQTLMDHLADWLQENT